MTVAGDPLIGTEFLGYRIEELVGRGGMGVVYRAYDLRLKRNVALKLIAPDLFQDENFRDRFLTETELAASLEHPNVVPIHDAGEYEGQLYLAMRYVEGSDLKALLRDEGALGSERATAICNDVAAALDAAHERGLVHRDVKPSNVLLDSHEHVYLADFGLSRRLSEQARGPGPSFSLGTPAYVAPEQIQGDDVDERADVYSLGCLTYECLTGEAPYPRESELAVLWAHLNDPPPSPPGLEQVMARALAKRPEERYASCSELAEAAREALGLGRPRRDRRPLVLAAVGALAAGALATGLVFALGDGGQPKPDLTVRNNSLVRVDAEDGRIKGVTPVGHGPQSVAGGADTVWTYNWDDRTVSQIDAATGTVERTVSVSGSPPFVTSNSVAADETGAWVISSAEGGGLLTHLRPGLRSREFPFDGDPVAVASGEGSVWVATKEVGRNEVLRVDPQTGAISATVRIPSKIPTSNLPDPSFPEVQALAVGEGAVWVLTGGFEGSAIMRIDPSTARITSTHSFATHQTAGLLSIVASNGTVWTVLPKTGTAKLVALEPRTLRVKGTRSSRMTGFASGIETLTAANDNIWWSNGDLGMLLRVDPRTYEVLSSTRITPRPDSWADFNPYAVAAAGDSVWVTVRVAP